MLAELSIYPLDGEHFSQDVAKVVHVLEQAGVQFRVGPMSTSLQGDLDQILDIVKQCHSAVSEGGRSRVVTQVTIDDHKSEAHSLSDAIARVEQQLGHPVSQS